MLRQNTLKSVYINLKPKKSGIKWHLMTITITISVRPLFIPHFTLHFTNCKTNAMTDRHIRSDVKCQMSNAMNFGFLIGINNSIINVINN